MRRALLHTALLAAWLACSAADATAQQDSDRTFTFGLSLEYSRMIIVTSDAALHSWDDLWTIAAGITVPVGDTRAARISIGRGIESGWYDPFWLAGVSLLFNVWGGMTEGVFIGMDYLYTPGTELCIGRFSRWNMDDAGDGLLLTAGAAVRIVKRSTLDLLLRIPVSRPDLYTSLRNESTLLLLGARVRVAF